MTDDGALEPLLTEFLTALWEEQPHTATAAGVDGHDDRLPDLSEAGYARRARADEDFGRRFAALADDVLTPVERIDRDLVRATVHGRELEREWAGWRRDPATYLGPGLSGVFALFLHRLRPEAELAAAAEARLRAVPELLDAGRRNLDPSLADPHLVTRALGPARAAVTYARSLVPAEVTDPSARTRLAAAGEVAARAYEDFAAWLADDLLPRASGGFAIGERLYSALIRRRDGLGYGAAELCERGRAAYDELAADLRRRTRDVAGHDDWRALLAELAEDRPATPEAMRAAYAEWTERARAFCRERQLVTFPDGEECLVEPSPPFQRPVLAVASYVAPPTFRPGRTGHFFVPYPPEGAGAEDVAQRLATNGHHSIPTISVHEAYPGHHWHLAWLADSPWPVRRVLGTPYFVEGWALYAEDMMREQGFFTDPRHELCQVDARLFRAARVVVDTSLHAGEMSVEEAVRFMSTKASLSEGTARTEVARYCAWPTQASSYLAGALEIGRLRDRWLADGRGTLREFHDALAGSGALPLDLAERALFGQGAPRSRFVEHYW